jgi:hypothetical protein
MEHLRVSEREIQQVQCGKYLTIQYSCPTIILFTPPSPQQDYFPGNESRAGAVALAQVAMLSRDERSQGVCQRNVNVL